MIKGLTSSNLCLGLLPREMVGREKEERLESLSYRGTVAARGFGREWRDLKDSQLSVGKGTPGKEFRVHCDAERLLAVCSV